jgi:hypothetical protein
MKPKDLGDYLDNLFDPELKKLNDMLDDLRRQSRVNDMIAALRSELMEARSDDELTEIIFKHLEILNRYPKLFKHVNSAKRRIHRLFKDQIEAWGLDTLN